jgi:hypothetical protein
MGCDIHMILERKWRDKWVGIHEVDSAARERNYDLFGRLAGVRRGDEDSPDPRGVPDDASDLSKMEIEGWGHGAHSHSWATLDEFLTAYIKTAPDSQRAKWVADRLESGSNDLKYRLTLELFRLYLD